jgi:cell division protease FtsH
MTSGAEYSPPYRSRSLASALVEPFGGAEDPAKLADVFTEDHHAVVGRHLQRERAVYVSMRFIVGTRLRLAHARRRTNGDRIKVGRPAVWDYDARDLMAPKPPKESPRAPGPLPSGPFGPRFWLWLLGFWLVLTVFRFVGAPLFGSEQISYSEFKTALREGRIVEVNLAQELITGTMKPKAGTPSEDAGPDGGEAPKDLAFRTIPVPDEDLMRELDRAEVKITGIADSGFAREWIPTLFMVGLFAGLFFLITRRMREGQGSFMAVGKSKAKVYVEKDVGVTFADVAGVDEAKEELSEVIEFLKTPEKFGRLGGKMPKGILLVGPPGTGKTLLARAVAGEAGVPFFSISGSDFVEMFVGVGAARVRDLFEQAKSKAPAIVFIDELDAIGKARGVGLNVHEEREQTLNQLLVELDGFDTRVGVIIMAATNRPEILDQALLRAGRFDRQVLVDRPDKIGRLAILKLHAKNVPLGPDADLERLAGITAGFAGADLANLVNEAALMAVRHARDAVAQADLDEAVERVIAGLEKKNRVLNPREKERVAHHEVGHALVAISLPGQDPVQKISIIPRGVAALGYTLQAPTEDRFLMTKAELENRIAVLLGGRAAEELIFGEISTGAADDLRKATDIARSMVVQYGMSEKLGQVSHARDTTPSFLGVRSEGRDFSEATAREIDLEIQAIIDGQYERSREILKNQLDALKRVALRLLEKESITGEELRELGRPPTS